MAFFGGRFFGSRFYGARFFGVPGELVEQPDEAIDTYAWFPGDRIPTGRRYEEYGEEEPKPRRRKRKPAEVIRDLIPLPPYVLDVPGYEDPEPFVPEPEFGDLPPQDPEPVAPPVPQRVIERNAAALAGRQTRDLQRQQLGAKVSSPRPGVTPANPEAQRQALHAKALANYQSTIARYQQYAAQAQAKARSR